MRQLCESVWGQLLIPIRIGEAIESETIQESAIDRITLRFRNPCFAYFSGYVTATYLRKHHFFEKCEMHLMSLFSKAKKDDWKFLLVVSDFSYFLCIYQTPTHRPFIQLSSTLARNLNFINWDFSSKNLPDELFFDPNISKFAKFTQGFLTLYGFSQLKSRRNAQWCFLKISSVDPIKVSHL